MNLSSESSVKTANNVDMEPVNMPGILALQRTDTSGDQTEGII